MTNRIIDASLLKTCKLWSGSSLELDFKFGGIRLSTILIEIEKREYVDDLTSDELDWFDALRKTRDIYLDGNGEMK